MWEMDKQAAGPLLISFMTVAHISISTQYLKWITCVASDLRWKEEWGVKAALKAGTPLCKCCLSCLQVLRGCLTPPPHRWTTLLQHCLLNASLLSISCQMQYYHSHIPTKMAIQLNGSFSAVAENSVFAREQTHHFSVEYCFIYCSRYWIEQIKKCCQSKLILK